MFAKELTTLLDNDTPYEQIIRKFEKSDGDWIDEWNSWHEDSAFEHMKNWFVELPFEIRQEMEYFDDCPVCTALKESHEFSTDLIY